MSVHLSLCFMIWNAYRRSEISTLALALGRNFIGGSTSGRESYDAHNDVVCL